MLRVCASPTGRSPIVLLAILISLVACTSCSQTDPDALVAELDAAIPAVVAAGNAPSMQVAVVRGDRIVWSRAFGEDAGVDRVYMNASVQKLFTAVAVLQLVEAGLVDLDADVGDHVPFPVRHPDFADTPITVRMLLAHRSGLDAFPHQFAWDTESVFWPQYRPACPESLRDLDLEGFLRESFTPGGANDDPKAWVAEPGRGYHYAVSGYPLLRYLVGRVSGVRYPDYLRKHVFDPLGMKDTGFRVDEFPGRHAIPYTRIDGENVEIPLWDGRGFFMHTTASDMAKLAIALIHDGRAGDVRILQPETVARMRRPTSRYKVLFRGGDDLAHRGRGLGHPILRGGWYGIGGSAPGYQCLLRFHPGRQVAFVLVTNVNAILGGGPNYASARGEIYAVQDALVSVLDPTYGMRSRAAEIGIVGALVLYVVVLVAWALRRRRMRRPAAR